MDAVLGTAVAILLMLIALAVLARNWPPSSRLTGFRLWMRGGSRDRPAEAQERGEASREDDDVHWRWDAPEPKSDADAEPDDRAGTRTRED